MKRFLLYLSALFVGVSFATAQETQVSIGTETGTLNNGTSKSSVWTANDTSIGLKITATDSNGNAVNAISNWAPTNKFYAAGQFATSESLSSSPTTFTISVENEDYVITGYSLKYKASVKDKVTLANEFTYSETPSSTSVYYYMVETELSTRSTKFTVASSDASRASNQSVNVIEFTVTVKKEGDEAQSYTLTVGETEWATLYLDFAVTIPAGVEVWTVSEIVDGYVVLGEVLDVIPAGCPVLVKASMSGDYEFAYTAGTGNEYVNLLQGTAVATYITDDAYVLTADDTSENGVCFGRAIKNQLDGTAWLNNANKAYLPASAVPNKTVAFYGFDWDGTTGIDEMTEQRAESKEIYDLTGRRVEEITAPGIYIVNGVKRVVR